MGELGSRVRVEMGWDGEGKLPLFTYFKQINKKKYGNEGRILLLFLHVHRHFNFFFQVKNEFFISNRRDNIFYIMLWRKIILRLKNWEILNIILKLSFKLKKKCKWGGQETIWVGLATIADLSRVQF